MKSEKVAGHQQLKFATALSVTRLVYQACINNTASVNLFPKSVMGNFCSAKDPLVVSDLVPWLKKQLTNATDDLERIAMLAALGNIGDEVILPAVLPYIASCEPSSQEETEWHRLHQRSTDDEDKEEDVSLPTKKKLRKKWLRHGKNKAVHKHSTVRQMIEKVYNDKGDKHKPDSEPKSRKGEKKNVKTGEEHHTVKVLLNLRLSINDWPFPISRHV